MAFSLTISSTLRAGLSGLTKTMANQLGKDNITVNAVLMGFCRTNLFKRLESSGFAFMQSIERHILRNFVCLHAIEKGLAIPIGTQDASLLDSRFTDADSDLFSDDEEDDGAASRDGSLAIGSVTEHRLQRNRKVCSITSHHIRIETARRRNETVR